jgi:hypothetical protein
LINSLIGIQQWIVLKVCSINVFGLDPEDTGIEKIEFTTGFEKKTAMKLYAIHHLRQIKQYY